MPLAFDIPVFRFGIVFVSSTLYGLFFILFVLSVLILHQQNKKLSLGCTSSTSVYLAFSYMTLVVLTAVWAISVVMCFKPALVDAPYIENYNPLMFSQHIIGYLAAIIGDTVMTYRLYIIWDRKRIILYISAILLPSAIGFILWGVIHYAMFGQVNQIPNIILASMTISVNVSCTSLIVWKIWDRNRLARAVGGEKVVLRLLAILVESSALYTVYLTLGYVLFALITTGWIFHWIMFLHPNLATGGDQTADWTSTFLFLQGIVDDVAIFVADLILIYRLYIVWNRSKTILCLGGAPIVAYVVLFIPYIVIPAKTKHYWEAGVAIMSFLNLGTNIVVTILISYRIWTTSRLTRALGDGKVIIKVIAIVVESAALQTDILKDVDGYLFNPPRP
ncbi:hypothetical protein D9756_008542 [Leucocoprinus leucothites]|uniref:Uncharacterized protein n=1 Tax=Leucocoprinus leucothites TaxID=201217 RepID=A0A8H5CYW3_9AGAR|nr:hypothetical protein D9756_008542 [Leucoagaricus leucothites]